MKFAIYHSSQGWLQDTCAGGTFCWDVEQAVQFANMGEALDAMRAAEISIIDDITIIRVK